MARRLKFPDPGECELRDKALMCPADRVIRLYNQEEDMGAQRISKTVRSWFTRAAHEHGWAAVMFLKQVGSQHGAGCVLVRPFEIVNAQITVTNKTLVLVEGDEGE